MGQSRTIGAVKSFFSKNRRRLDLDRLAEEANAKMAASEMTDAAPQVRHTPVVTSLSCPSCTCCGGVWLLVLLQPGISRQFMSTYRLGRWHEVLIRNKELPVGF